MSKSTQENWSRGSSVQSVLIPRDQYSLAQAKRWLSANGFKISKVDVTTNYYRFRQADPTHFTTFRTKELGDSGIKIVFGPKKARYNPEGLHETFRQHLVDDLKSYEHLVGEDVDALSELARQNPERSWRQFLGVAYVGEVYLDDGQIGGGVWTMGRSGEPVLLNRLRSVAAAKAWAQAQGYKMIGVLGGQKLSSNPVPTSEVHYTQFHGVPPSRILKITFWVPGELVFVGWGIDVGYGINDPKSRKDGFYVHDFGPDVGVWRRCKAREQPEAVYEGFPKEVMMLGRGLGFTVVNEDGTAKEYSQGRATKLCVTPNRRTLVIVGTRGVEYLLEGGGMRVEDWIQD